jgi:uncharacterized protein YfaS (alpha-2-macroglobulin family)
MALFPASCGKTEKPQVRLALRKPGDLSEIAVPIDKGFSEYITGYTSGVVSVNSPVEIRFTPEFASKANRKIPAGLFMFEPAVRGTAEWKDDVTLVFRPLKILEAGTVFTGRLNLDRLAEVKESLGSFPIIIRTIKKDFIVTTGALESSEEGDKYSLNGQITASDYIPSGEVESYLQAKLGRKKMDIIWNHADPLIHRFVVADIYRSEKAQNMELKWDGSQAKVRQKGTANIKIPPKDDFSVIDLIVHKGEDQRIDIIFSDPLLPDQETEGLIWFSPANEMPVSIRSNIASIYSVPSAEGITELNIETSLKNFKGALLSSPFSTKIDFSPSVPSVELTGRGVILPSSQNLIFPFKAVNLRAVDIKIIKIFENNLPHFLQENEINTGYSVKRFGRPVYSGKVDLINPSGDDPSGWNLYTVDLSEYIDVEPGILYRVELSMRPSYSLYPCSDTEEMRKYEEMLKIVEENNRRFWDDPENYYSDSDDFIYYSFGFDWRDRDDPCKAAYFNPGRKVSRNILASNFGIIAKKDSDNDLSVMVNDLLTALPLSEVEIRVYDFQLQEIIVGITDKNGTARLKCDTKPFLIIARKDKDRNYLKLNDGSSLSLSSFDVSGIKPEEGIKVFICGERDVWRPGDSIYLSCFLKDMNNAIPPDHPVLFELVNPLAQTMDTQVQKSAGKNLMVFRTFTPPDAVTGNYTAQFRIGGALFTKRIRVETIKPNRLKIDLNFPGELLGGTGKSSKGTLNVKWLNGLAAGNLRSSVEYILKPARTEFSGYNRFNFDDPAVQFYSVTSKMFEGSVDENGHANVIFNPVDEIRAPGMMNAVFTAKATEKGGDESIIQAVFKYAPYTLFAGIDLPDLNDRDRMLFTDKDIKVDIATVDPKGNPVSTGAEVNIYRISYRWWWESDQEDLAAYISNEIYKPVITKNIRTSEGEGSFTFRIARNEWGRYLIRVSLPGGHSTGEVVLIDWPWEYGMKSNSEGATLLAVKTDREKYNPGDEVRLNFPAPENSRIIVTLENSVKVLEEIRATGTGGNTTVSFRAKPEMAPNIYAYVNVIQPHDQTINDIPVRLYGVIPVMVEDPSTRLKPEISMPGQLKSMQKFEIRVSETDSKPMIYTLAVVDEGLLDITGFRTPDPWNYFYAREALGVQTWYIYDMVLGAFGGTIERIFAVGGDEAVIDRAANKAQRFVPVVRFLGPFTLGPGRTATHSITLPQYTGSVRTMVIAGNDRAFGYAEESVTVKDPLMILATAPRIVSPGEKVSLPVTLFIQKETIRSVDLIAESNDLITFAENVRTIEVSGTGEKNVDLVFTSGDRTGTAKIKIKASGGGESAVYDIEMDVRSPNPSETRAELKLLKPGEKWETSLIPFGMEGSNSAVLEASLLPAVNLEKHLGYLREYPHGCTEQIIAAAFPGLWIRDLSAIDQSQADAASKNISEAVASIASRQMNNGGIALWPGNYQPDNWITSFAGHFAAEAERKGYTIPDDFKRKWLNYQKRTSQEWRFDPKFRQSANEQAYRLFTLAFSGSPERGAMNRLRETENVPQVAKWFLAAAFATSGRPEVAAGLLDMRNTETEKEYSDYYYGSRLRDKAVILYTLALLKKENEALPLLKDICDDLNRDTWLSTQSVAWGLFSYMKFSEIVTPDNTGQAKFNLIINGQRSEQSMEQNKILLTNLNPDKGQNNLIVENISGRPVYFNIVMKGIPLIPDKSAPEKGLSLKTEYMDTGMRPVNHRYLEQGTDFMMVAKVTNTSFSQLEHIALTQMVPSGWEILNTRLFETNYGISESSYDYRDIRDDRVSTYFTLEKGETKTFVLILNAAYKGEFNLPSVWCEAMYTENCYSGVPGDKVVVAGR